MKKLIIIVAFLASLGCYAQDTPPIPFKLYDRVMVDENDSIITAEFTGGVDSTVGNYIRLLTSDDIANFQWVYSLWNGLGNPFALFPSKSVMYDQPTWLVGISDNIIDWTGTSAQYIDGNGGYHTFPIIPTLTTQIAESGTTNIYFNNTRARGAFSAGTGIGINSSTGVISNSSPDQTVALTGSGGVTTGGTYPNLTVSLTGKSTHHPTRSLSTTGTNNTFTPSSTLDSFVSYTVNFAYSISALLGGCNGEVDLDYSTNGGTTWVPVNSVSNVIGLSITLSGNNNMVLSGLIPAGALVRLYQTSTTNSTASIVTNRQNEYY